MTQAVGLGPASCGEGEDAPVVLALDGGDVGAATEAIYDRFRHGRRVIAHVCGGADARQALASALDAIGIAVAGAGSPDVGAVVRLLAARSPADARPLAAPPQPAPTRVAIAGCGVVGGGLLTRLRADPRFEVAGVLVRDAGRVRDVALPVDLLVTDPQALLDRAPQVLVDVLSAADAGRALGVASLERGVHLVSANKQAIVADLPGLHALAAASGASLRYSASVGGGAPMVETVRRARALGRVASIAAVVNGTCNHLLNRLAQGIGFADALAETQAAGFAEADPSADLTGRDAAAKLSILAYEAGVALAPAAVARETLARSPGAGVWRQVATLDTRACRGAVRLRPAPLGAAFADLPDAFNAIRVTLDDGRVLTTRARGAGRAPTVASLWADLLDTRAASA